MMKRRLRAIFATLLSTMLLVVPTLADAGENPDCELQTIPGGIECLDETGQPAWELAHPALWGDSEAYERDQKDVSEPIGPVELDDGTFYGVRRDLLKIDTADGIVVDRTRFPAPISALEVAEDHLQVTVTDHFEELSDRDDTESVTISHTPGDPSPPQYVWSAPEGEDLFLTSRDADWRTRKASDTEQALQLLRQARDIDPTNPFFAQQIGELLKERGDREAAMRAFEQAAESPDAVGRYLLAVSSRLESADAPDQADRAFQRGLEQMERAGIDRERLSGMVSVATSLMMPRGEDSPIGAAIESADPEKLDRLISRFAQLAPYVESGHYNWETVANWMAALGEDELAEKWHRIADENREYAYDIFTRNVLQIDRAILALVSISLALVILALLIGMRGGLARRRLFDRDDGDGHNLWIPKIRPRDLVVVAGLFVVVFAIPFYLATHATVIDRLSEGPVASAQDGLASPATIEWLDSLSDSSSLEQLVSTALKEQQALERGEPLPEKEPIIHDLIQALYEDARHQQLELLRQGRMPDLVVTVQHGHDGAVAIDEVESMSLAVAAVPFGVLLLLGFIGSVIGARAPRLARPILFVVPGGSRRLAPIGALMLVAMLAAIGAHAGLDSAVYEATQPQFLEYFGLQSLREHTPSPSRLWAWATLGIVLLYQGAVATWEFRSGT